MNRFVSIGFDNFVDRNRVVAVLKPGSSPMRKLKEQKKKDGMLIDVSGGKPARSFILLDNGVLFLSPHLPGTIAERMENED